jgi:hypothetical protein
VEKQLFVTTNRLPAPGTKIPKLAGDSPFAGVTSFLVHRKSPRLSNFCATPWTVAHEGHHWFSATSVGTLRRIPLVRIETIGFGNEAGPVAPGTVIPVHFHAALATRTIRRHLGL